MDLKKSKNLSKSSISVLKMESRIRLQGLPFTTHKVALFFCYYTCISSNHHLKIVLYAFFILLL